MLILVLACFRSVSQPLTVTAYCASMLLFPSRFAVKNGPLTTKAAVETRLVWFNYPFFFSQDSDYILF